MGKVMSRAGLVHDEKQRLMALAAGWMGGGGFEPSAGSYGTPRALRASNQRPPDEKSTVNAMLTALFSTPLARSKPA